ncbi:serine carboxypeptidase S28-domain-containing protein [Syncephalastrum racemosum]|uniref:Serine carboxypeptidase S28-domain-containing protein n=1 Tax=Syncephalastrum racemosum TaxID=13706 RepID=A0A1X2H3U3_SYNRA|nr:serine carboxypeptidase S28-domain-containing protein [Syncephalastrum racemosum]
MKLGVCLFTLFALAVLGHVGYAMHFPGWRLHRHTSLRASAADDDKLDPRFGPFYFDQPIDHNAPDNGTFKHRYWANHDWYKPGGPVILYNAGETPADDRSKYVVNSTMAELARALDGAVIVIEHRNYGKSQPGSDLSVDNLKHLTTSQALEDMATFIRDAEIPDLGNLNPAEGTRWIVYGGSYSGNLAAWMRYRYPDLVFAAVPSSAPVEMRFNYYQYFEVIQKYAPSECVSAIERVIRFVDLILFNPLLHEDKKELKKKFGVEELIHDDDFAERKYTS